MGKNFLFKNKISLEELFAQIKKDYSNTYKIFSNKEDAKKYFGKYEHTKNTFSKKLKDTLVCYSGDYCEAVNDYINHHLENEGIDDYNIRKHQWKNAIIKQCLNVLYNYDNWIELQDNVIAIRYINCQKLRLDSKTLISTSLNLNVMNEVFKLNLYFNGAPYQMGESNVVLFILIKKGEKFLSYDQLDDYCAIKQSELLLPAYTKFEVVKKYNIKNSKIKKAYILKIKN